jgi:diacylglycerol O-acyltransferase / wax synthase
MTALARLSSADLTNLAVEAPDTPMHQAVLASLDAGPLLDERGALRLREIQAHIEARLDRVPELRRILFRPHVLAGRPLWIDDPDFRIENHVQAARLDPPGGEAAALVFAESQMSRLMDRSRPLWRIWLLEGYSADRLGMLIKIHHALADGHAIVNMLAQIFDLEPVGMDRPSSTWSPSARPSTRALVADNLNSKSRSVAGVLRRLAHPWVMARSARSAIAGTAEALRQTRGAPRTSLNRPIEASRSVGAIHISLQGAKSVAHACDAKLNDMFLGLVATALRSVLASRGEPIRGPLRASVAVSRASSSDTSGNHVGTVVVPLPMDVADPRCLLTGVARSSARAKATQKALASTGLMVFLARTGITRAFIRRQHMINVLTTDLPGPPVPLYLAGAEVRDPIALPPIAGNVTVSFAALSYAGDLAVSFVADASAWPDARQLTDALRSSWLEFGQLLLREPFAVLSA